MKLTLSFYLSLGLLLLSIGTIDGKKHHLRHSHVAESTVEHDHKLTHHHHHETHAAIDLTHLNTLAGMFRVSSPNQGMTAVAVVENAGVDQFWIANNRHYYPLTTIVPDILNGIAGGDAMNAFGTLLNDAEKAFAIGGNVAGSNEAKTVDYYERFITRYLENGGTNAGPLAAWIDANELYRLPIVDLTAPGAPNIEYHAEMKLVGHAVQLRAGGATVKDFFDQNNNIHIGTAAGACHKCRTIYNSLANDNFVYNQAAYPRWGAIGYLLPPWAQNNARVTQATLLAQARAEVTNHNNNNVAQYVVPVNLNDAYTWYANGTD